MTDPELEELLPLLVRAHDGLLLELRGTIVVDGDEEGCQVELEVAPSFVLSSARRALARVTKRLHALGLRSVT